MQKKISACGNDCAACPRYIATQSGDPGELEMVAELWYRCGWRDKVVGIKDIMCKGCTTSSVCKYGIIECVAERNLSNCGLCTEYPCTKINEAFKKSSEYYEIVQENCSNSEVIVLQNVFFNKKQRLEAFKNGCLKR
jgi:hypothetical protein